MDPDKIGVTAEKVITKRKVAKHFLLDIGEGRLGGAPSAGPPGSVPASERPPVTDPRRASVSAGHHSGSQKGRLPAWEVYYRDFGS